MIIPQSAIKNHSRIPISGEQKIEIVCRVRNHLKAILSYRSILEFVLKLSVYKSRGPILYPFTYARAVGAAPAAPLSGAEEGSKDTRQLE